MSKIGFSTYPTLLWAFLVNPSNRSKLAVKYRFPCGSRMRNASSESETLQEGLPEAAVTLGEKPKNPAPFGKHWEVVIMFDYQMKTSPVPLWSKTATLLTPYSYIYIYIICIIIYIHIDMYTMTLSN